MKPKKLIRYRLPVSVKFPATHPRKGEPTYFVEKIKSGQCKWDDCSFNCSECDINRYMIEHTPKLHTIRGNYALWAKRFEKINKGEAVLELYYWSGKPYNSATVTVCQLGKDDGVGIQEVYFIFQNIYDPVVGRGIDVSFAELSTNDGLSIDDFKDWFKGFDLSETMAIIHFTPFRY